MPMQSVQRTTLQSRISYPAMEVAGERSITKNIHDRLGPIKPPAAGRKQNRVCRFYLNGNCNRYDCQFIHIKSLGEVSNGYATKRGLEQRPFPACKKPVCQTALKWVRDCKTMNDNVALSPASRTFNAPATKAPVASISTLKAPAGPIVSPKIPGALSGASETSPAPAIAMKNPVAPATASKTPTAPISAAKIPTASSGTLETSPAPAIASMAHDGATKSSAAHTSAVETPEAPASKNFNKACTQWMEENCSNGEKCHYLHSWSVGEDYTCLASLEGHQKSVSGIALPDGSDKLYTGSKDESVRIWDCHTGNCAGVIDLGGEVGCLISNGPWIFVGIPNMVKAWNIQTSTDLSLSGPVGQVYALSFRDDILFAGTQDGSILAWRYNVAGSCFEEPTSLTGHDLAVVSLFAGANWLFSGSMDHRVKVWDLESFQCLYTLTDHTSAVMSVLCWDEYLLSSSLDNTIKVWALNEQETLEVIYTHNEEHGVLSLNGVYDSNEKPVLMCSCIDNAVRLYELPSFSERGRIFAKREVQSMRAGPHGLFFTGDATGRIKVWRWSSKQGGAPASALP